MKLKEYCNEKGIRFIGDVPIYVSYDSVDVWVNPGIFKLDKDKQLRFLSGVPPDYFSQTGQLWGNSPASCGEIRSMTGISSRKQTLPGGCSGSNKT